MCSIAKASLSRRSDCTCTPSSCGRFTFSSHLVNNLTIDLTSQQQTAFSHDKSCRQHLICAPLLNRSPANAARCSTHSHSSPSASLHQ